MGTDSIILTDSLKFEVVDKDNLLICFSGSPIILTKTLQLNRKRQGKIGVLNTMLLNATKTMYKGVICRICTGVQWKIKRPKIGSFLGSTLGFEWELD